jgi:hypothetical protein
VISDAGYSFPSVDLFRGVRLTVYDGVLGVNGCAIEFGEPGLPEIERFYDIASMRVAIGIYKMLRHCLRCRSAASWGRLNVKEFCHSAFCELMATVRRVALRRYCASVGFSGAPDGLMLATSFEIAHVRFQGMIYTGR